MTAGEGGTRIFDGVSGLRVAVTGATRGIGRAMAVAFGAAGARVLVHGRREEALAEAAAAAREAGAMDVAAVRGDLTDATLGARLADSAVDRWGGLDVLVLNAASLGPMERLRDTPRDTFVSVLEVGVTAQVDLYRATIPVLRAQPRGLVLWMSSGLGRFGLPRFGVYAACKHALEGLMRVAHEEDSEAGVVHATIAPGMVQTEMLKAAMLGGDTSDADSPARVARGFVRLVETATEDLGGKSLDIAPWLPPADGDEHLLPRHGGDPSADEEPDTLVDPD